MARGLVIGTAAALFATLVGGLLIDWLRARGFGKAISAEGPESHQSKAGTPTMGGLLVIGTLFIFTVFTNLWGHPSILLPIGIMAVAAAVGYADDLLTIQGRARIGGHERGGLIVKALLGAALGLAAGLVSYYSLDIDHVLVPNYGVYHWNVVAIVLASVAVVAGTTSSVAISDGLDGLLGGLLVVAYGAYGLLAVFQGESHLAVFCFTVVGALVGFLWYNSHPARVFMGEVGALPLGAGLGTVAIMLGWWLLLPVIGIVFVAEALSDVIQIAGEQTGLASLEKRGRRVFRMAPLHHHFELAGWAETQVVTRFCLVGLGGAMLGVALALTH
jgi:phospho-N-acetylmuramoyl-pentapeptide-transferase